MEDIIFQIYGTFVLTLAGFVLPIIAIALSLFPEGFKVLKQKYENEQKQAEGNLTIELEKQRTNKEINYDDLNKTISTLKSTKRKSKKRLSYLNPLSIMSKSIIAIGISLDFFLLSIYLIDSPFYYQFLLIIFLSVVSIIFAIRTIMIFVNSIGIIIEASTAVQEIRKASEEKILELLTALVDNSKKGDQSIFIDKKYIIVLFDNKKAVDNNKYTFSVNKKCLIEVHLTNLSVYMLKNIEHGFTFPKEFLVEGNTISSTYTSNTEKIIRFKYDYIQSKVNLKGEIDITFLKTGIFDVDTFIKGENLKNKRIKFKIEVIE